MRIIEYYKNNYHNRRNHADSTEAGAIEMSGVRTKFWGISCSRTNESIRLNS